MTDRSGVRGPNDPTRAENDTSGTDVASNPVLDRSFASFRDLLVSHDRVESILQSVCTEVVATVPGADMAGVTLLDPQSGKPSTSAATDARVTTIESDQYRTGEGPALDAARGHRVVRVGGDAVERTWRSFGRSVADIGVQAYLSAPISFGDNGSGSLNVYGWSPRGFTDIDSVLVTLFVAAVEGAVINARRATRAQTELDGLQEAMRTRATIEQAKGIVMAIRGLPAARAFDVLSLQSQNENVKLATIAQRIVHSVVTKGEASEAGYDIGPRADG